MVEFIYAKSPIYVGLFGYIDEREGAQIVSYQRNIRSQTRNTLVHILERLQIRQLPITKNACSNGSGMAAAFCSNRRKQFSRTWGMANGWKTDSEISTGLRRNRPVVSSSGSRFSERMACRLRKVNGLNPI